MLYLLVIKKINLKFLIERIDGHLVLGKNIV